VPYSNVTEIKLIIVSTQIPTPREDFTGSQSGPSGLPPVGIWVTAILCLIDPEDLLLDPLF
jgi:hypothetical protein